MSRLDLRLRVCRDGRRPKDWDGLPIRSVGQHWQPGDVKKAAKGGGGGGGGMHGDGGRASSTLGMEAKTEKPLFLLSFLLYIQLHADSRTERK